jgi:hypothetical protein
MQDDTENLSEDAIWIMRGGSFADGLANIRAAVRGGVDPWRAQHRHRFSHRYQRSLKLPISSHFLFG